MKIFPDYLPPQFGVFLLMLSVVLIVTGFLTDKDFGLFRTPSLDPRAQKITRIVGIFLLIATVLMHTVPIQKKKSDVGGEISIVEEVIPAEEKAVPTEEKAVPDEEEVIPSEEKTIPAVENVIPVEKEVVPPKIASCRHESFGIERWNSSNTVTKTSGWVKGGTYSPDWCAHLLSQEISARNIGVLNKTDTLNSSEQARWTGLFGRTREYNYTCTVTLEWDPTFNMRADENICGLK